MVVLIWLSVGLSLLSVIGVVAVALRVRRSQGIISQRLGRLEQECQWSSLQLIQMRGREIQQTTPGHRLDVQCFSQYGEEPILWALLGYKPKGYYVEVGAYDGVRLSTSYFFESIGWNGLLIEANPELFERCRDSRPGSKVVNAAIGGRGASGTIIFSKVTGEEGVDALGFLEASDAHRDLVRQKGGRVETAEVMLTNLAELLDQEQPESLDLLIVDIEGLEATALEGLDLGRWKPRVVMVEHNVTGLEVNYPSARILKNYEYTLYTRIKGNDIYISRAVQSTV